MFSREVSIGATMIRPSGPVCADLLAQTDKNMSKSLFHCCRGNSYAKMLIAVCERPPLGRPQAWLFMLYKVPIHPPRSAQRSTLINVACNIPDSSSSY